MEIATWRPMSRSVRKRPRRPAGPLWKRFGLVRDYGKVRVVDEVSLQGRPRGGGRPARAQRRRQDDDLLHDRRACFPPGAERSILGRRTSRGFRCTAAPVSVSAISRRSRASSAGSRSGRTSWPFSRPLPLSQEPQRRPALRAAPDRTSTSCTCATARGCTSPEGSAGGSRSAGPW